MDKRERYTRAKSQLFQKRVRRQAYENMTRNVCRFMVSPLVFLYVGVFVVDFWAKIKDKKYYKS